MSCHGYGDISQYGKETEMVDMSRQCKPPK